MSDRKQHRRSQPRGRRDHKRWKRAAPGRWLRWRELARWLAPGTPHSNPPVRDARGEHVDVLAMIRKRAMTVVIVSSIGCGGWTKRDTVLEAGCQLANLADQQETYRIGRAGLEANPLFGQHGERFWVVAPTVLLGHAAVSLALPPKWRTRWQVATLGVEGLVLARNASMGWWPLVNDPVNESARSTQK